MSIREKMNIIRTATLVVLVVMNIALICTVQSQWDWIQQLQDENKAQSEMLGAQNRLIAKIAGHVSENKRRLESIEEYLGTCGTTGVDADVLAWMNIATQWMRAAHQKIDELETRIEFLEGECVPRQTPGAYPQPVPLQASREGRG